MRVPLLPPALTSLGDFAFIDVETTGARPLEDRVTEIAIIRFHANGEQTLAIADQSGVPIPARSRRDRHHQCHGARCARLFSPCAMT